MFAPAATAARTASEPEWSNVPSPMFWVKWSRSRNGAMPIHCNPSPPIWDTPVTVPACSESISITRAWQPMPAPTRVPGSGLVELLCGQPEQKYGTLLASGGLTSGSIMRSAGRSGSGAAGMPRAVIRRRSGPVIASASSSP